MSAKTIKLNQKHFKQFKTYCAYYAKKYKLDSWELYFEFKLQPGTFAQNKINSIDHICAITLNTEWDSFGITNIAQELKLTAKHEVIHILIGRLSGLNNARFVTEDEVSEAEESLVRKLTNLL